MFDLAAAFKKYADENDFEPYFLTFEKIENPRATRPEVLAFLLLDELVPARKDVTQSMVKYTSDSRVVLDVDLEALAASGITEDQVLMLVRCGVEYEENVGLFTWTWNPKWEPNVTVPPRSR